MYISQTYVKINKWVPTVQFVQVVWERSSVGPEGRSEFIQTLSDGEDDDNGGFPPPPSACARLGRGRSRKYPEGIEGVLDNYVRAPGWTGLMLEVRGHCVINSVTLLPLPNSKDTGRLPVPRNVPRPRRFCRYSFSGSSNYKPTDQESCDSSLSSTVGPQTEADAQVVARSCRAWKAPGLIPDSHSSDRSKCPWARHWPWHCSWVLGVNVKRP